MLFPEPKLQDSEAAKFVWYPELQIGFYPVIADPLQVYNKDYFERYMGYSGTHIEEELNDARVDLIHALFNANGDDSSTVVVDVGVGNGSFVLKAEMDLAARVFGTDINPVAVEWLKDQEVYLDLNGQREVDYLCFWDSLEHIPDLSQILSKPKKGIFVSCPIYKNAEHVLVSKHYRKDEHFWYWTKQGLIAHMHAHGYTCWYSDDRETQIGRADIMSFVFLRSENNKN